MRNTKPSKDIQGTYFFLAEEKPDGANVTAVNRLHRNQCQKIGEETFLILTSSFSLTTQTDGTKTEPSVLHVTGQAEFTKWNH